MSRTKLEQKYQACLPEIGRRLRAVRDHANLSQEQIATVLGFSRRQWSSWEYAQVSLPVWALWEIAKIFGIDPGWVLMGGGDSPRMMSLTAGGDKRQRRISTKISRAVQNLGLVVTADFEQTLVRIIVDQPEENEREATTKVMTMLRELALGKGLLT